MLGEVVGRHESQDVGLETVEVWVVERLDGGFLDGAVHPFGLTVGPRMVWRNSPRFRRCAASLE